MYVCVYIMYTYIHTYICIYHYAHKYFNTQPTPRQNSNAWSCPPTRDCDSIGLDRAQETALERLAQRASKQVSEYILHLNSGKKK